jgi:hypothetical protein
MRSYGFGNEVSRSFTKICLEKPDLGIRMSLGSSSLNFCLGHTSSLNFCLGHTSSLNFGLGQTQSVLHVEGKPYEFLAALRLLFIVAISRVFVLA